MWLLASKGASRLQANTAPDVAKLLPSTLSTAEASQAIQFFLSLGVDSQISGLGKVCKDLEPLLSVDVALQPALRQYWKRAKRINDKTLGSSSTKSSAMPVSGVVQRYPVLTCLGTSAFPHQSSQIASLKRILVAGCILRAHSLPGSDCINRAADEIRLACEPYGERHNSVLTLPVGPIGLEYLIELRNSSRALQKPLPSSSRAYGFLAAVLRLTEYVLQFRRFPRVLGSGTADSSEHSLSILGTIQVAEIDPDQASLADPEPLLQLQEPLTAPGDELSQEGFKASGIRTLYWLAQCESGVLWQRNRISPYEWPALQDLLGSLPALAKQGKVSAPEALLAGLVAATGLEPDELLSMNIGTDAELTWSGKYRRTILRPEGAFDPSDQPNASDLYEGGGLADVTFDLPPPIKDLLRACRPETSAQAGTLGGALGLNMGSPDRLSTVSTGFREVCGDLLRKHVNTRLTYRHLRLVLRYATYEQSRDPLLVYLIAARPNLAPPTQMYYGSISVDRVLEVHRTVMQRIFGTL